MLTLRDEEGSDVAQQRHPGLRTIVIAMAAVVALAACGGGSGETDTAAREALFEANCARCHGPEATGSQMGPPLVHEVYEPSHHGDDAFRSAVANGVQPHHWEFGPMPAVPGVSTGDVDAIVAYVRGLQREAGIE